MTKEDETAIRDIVSKQEAAWCKGDASAFAESFHPEGTFTNVLGQMFVGDKAFHDRHAFLLNTVAKDSRLSLQIERVHFPLPNTALVDVLSTLNAFKELLSGVQAHNDAVLSRLLEVMVKMDGKWWVVAYHNVDIKPLPSPPPPPPPAPSRPT